MLRVLLREEMSSASIGIHLVDQEARAGGKIYIAEPSKLTFSERKEGEWLPEPWLRMAHDRAREFFQSLCDEMARMGYKPNTDRIAGELEGIKGHLKREQEMNDRHIRLIEMLIPER